MLGVWRGSSQAVCSPVNLRQSANQGTLSAAWEAKPWATLNTAHKTYRNSLTCFKQASLLSCLEFDSKIDIEHICTVKMTLQIPARPEVTKSAY